MVLDMKLKVKIFFVSTLKVFLHFLISVVHKVAVHLIVAPHSNVSRGRNKLETGYAERNVSLIA